MTGHSGFVTGVAFSADGRLLASGGLDGTVRVWVWDAAGHDLVDLVDLPGGAVNAVAVDRASGHVAVATQNGSAYVVTCESCGSADELVRLARTRATRGLTDAERAQFGVG